MVSWGILSGCMAFIGGEWSFYVVRLLLGAAEAGFFPGIIFYLTLWFPRSIALASSVCSWRRFLARLCLVRRFPPLCCTWMASPG